MHLRAHVLPLFLLVLLAATAASALGDNATASQSGCQVCAATGDCTRAYHGGPGQFCGNWLDRSNTRQSCCCPIDAACRVTNYACNCAYANRGGDGYGNVYGGRDSYALEWLWWLLGSLLLFFCCGSFLFAFCRSRRQDVAETPVAYAAAEPAPTYGAYGSTPSAPVYTAQPVYGPGPGVVQQPVYSGGGRSGGGMSAGAGAALGGGAGLLGGLLLGEAIADAGRPNYGGGGFDGGGAAADGFDGGGDFGGDF
ncbi:hypothetical protein PybrP1_000040 [[Pythium] brassicae (nom. inval.)]|nr:hypothetical protein PybrP1_000040 [[Pythium] brassicae (nom. inval.)]